MFGTNGQCGWHNKPLFKGPGIVIGRKGQGPLGVEWVDRDYWVIDTGYSLVPKSDDIDLKFAYFLIKYIGLNHLKDGTSNPTLSREVFGAQALPLPPIEQQRAIAATLGALDDKIELNRRMNATLEAMARALFRDWFVDFGPTRAKMAQSAAGAKNQNEPAAPYLSPDLWSLFPDRLDDAGKPEGWEFEAVIDQADWINGAAYKNMHFSDSPDALPVIKIAELKNGVTEKTAWTATDLGSRYLINDGELLFSWSGNPDTSIDTFLWSGGKAWLNQHIFAVRETEKRSKPFLHAMLKFLKPEFAELAHNKQTTGLGHVTKADMQRMLICIAPETAHQAFDKLVAPIFDRAFLLQTESRTLTQTRDLLLPRLMSGELRVAEAERAVETVL
ncbi:Type I restriction modification DNA specificity domain protein [Roseisalinus antarcticus]|uniref:Type I restriction modification DNA specificity domain protein n=1 Tax=Roseisalinus antarcticus TaxID=254357 RepID=A0A1Y5TXP0_9RHOB|nr:Type I restriction modification DNA specificity domain protein [Roseisalinus antarcticus]